MVRKILIPALTTVTVVAAMLYQAREEDPVLCAAPEVSMPEVAGFDWEPVEPSEAELTVLPSDTLILKRIYRNAFGHWFQVNVIVGGRSKSSVHRPELCLPSQGFQMRRPQTLDAGGVSWHCVELAQGDRPSIGFAYTFFNQAGFRTSSHFLRILRDVWDRSVLGRIDRWVMVTVQSSVAEPRMLAALLSQLKEVAE